MSGPRVLRNFIAGEYVDGRTESSTDIVNPATGSVVATAPVSSQVATVTVQRLSRSSSINSTGPDAVSPGGSASASTAKRSHTFSTWWAELA